MSQDGVLGDHAQFRQACESCVLSSKGEHEPDIICFTSSGCEYIYCWLVAHMFVDFSWIRSCGLH